MGTGQMSTVNGLVKSGARTRSVEVGTQCIRVVNTGMGELVAVRVDKTRDLWCKCIDLVDDMGELAGLR